MLNKSWPLGLHGTRIASFFLSILNSFHLLLVLKRFFFVWFLVSLLISMQFFYSRKKTQWILPERNASTKFISYVSKKFIRMCLWEDTIISHIQNRIKFKKINKIKSKKIKVDKMQKSNKKMLIQKRKFMIRTEIP